MRPPGLFCAAPDPLTLPIKVNVRVRLLSGITVLSSKRQPMESGMIYQPKRSSKRWLEGAPAPVLAVYDNGGKTCDRYTVLFGAPFWEPSMGRTVPYLGMSEHPSHPQGFGQHGEMPAYNRAACGRKIKYADLPPDCKRLVESDCRLDD
jgi:hypothetical protein